MAKFFEEIKKKTGILKFDDQENTVKEASIEKEPLINDKTETPAQKRRWEEFCMEITKGHEIENEYENISRNQVKDELNKRIQEKLSQFNEADEILEQIRIDREKERQEADVKRETRRKKRAEKNKQQMSMDPIITEDAVIAVFQNEEKEQIQEETNQSETTSSTSLIEGQITIRDINEEIRKAKEEEEKESSPDITEMSYKELVNGEGLPTDKFFDVLRKVIHQVILFFVGIKDKIVSFIVRKKPEKAIEYEKRRTKLRSKIKGVVNSITAFEKRVSTKLVNWVNRVDDRNDLMAEKAEIVTKQNEIRFHRTRQLIDINKKRIVLCFSGGVAIILVLIGAINYMTAYEYSYNGKVLGLVKEQQDVLMILDVVSEQLTKEYGAEVSIDQEEDIAFNRVWNLKTRIDDMEHVLRKLTYMQDMSVKGCGIYVEDELISIVDTEAAARDILQYVMDVYSPESESVQYEDVGFAENIELLPVDTKLGKLSSKEDVIYKILTGAEEQKVHVVNAGETFSGIAAKYGISQADLQASNPTVAPERLSIGQEIVLTQAVPLLTVQTVEVSTYIEYLPYDTLYEDNANIYTGETSTKRRGENGERQVTAKIVRNNGTEIAKLELNSVITKEPVTAIIYKGTKALPPKKGTGTFIYPVSSYTLTSKFGTRWGRMHYGIDLAAPTGTKIRASDGGTVIFSGYQGSYGYVVKIDHGGGFVTVYAHCSKLYVKRGEQVYQGQHIANVGNTGRSTGPHCHFEIQYLGVQKNPLNYL